MRKIEMSYSPYELKTEMIVDGLNVKESESYNKFAEFLEEGVPLQTWLEPIPYRDWEGFVNELADPEINDKIEIEFKGRRLDFEDLEHALEDQNAERGRLAKVIFTCKHIEDSGDEERARTIEQAMQELNKVKGLINSSGVEKIKEEYKDLENKYAVAKENIFNIVLAGSYGSGKSTMLNVLMRHAVLPMNASFYATKRCTIVHDATVGKGISLFGYDEEGALVYQEQSFANDAECAAAVQKICSAKEQGNIVELEFRVNLGHLYPQNERGEQLTIVLKDTPDMDSNDPVVKKINTHAEATIKIISESNKPMIIFCANKNYRESKSIDEFMRVIFKQFKEEKNALNDKFLFLMNKSDIVKFNRSYTATDAKNEFVDYLTNVDQWSVEDNEADLKELKDEAAKFMPKIFMTAGLVEEAIQKMNVNSMDQLDQEEAIALESFIKKLLDGTNKSKNYRFADYCDLPNYRKDAIGCQFAQAYAAYEENESFENAVKAAHLQTGIISLEYAIRDYLERYAYPANIRDLLKGLDAMPKLLEELYKCNLKEEELLTIELERLQKEREEKLNETQKIGTNLDFIRNSEKQREEDYADSMQKVEEGFCHGENTLDKWEDALEKCIDNIELPYVDFERQRDDLLIKLSMGAQMLKDNVLEKVTPNFTIKEQAAPKNEKFTEMVKKYIRMGFSKEPANRIAYAELCCIYGMDEISNSFKNETKDSLLKICPLINNLLNIKEVSEEQHNVIYNLLSKDRFITEAFAKLVVDYLAEKASKLTNEEKLSYISEISSKTSLVGNSSYWMRAWKLKNQVSSTDYDGIFSFVKGNGAKDRQALTNEDKCEEASKYNAEVDDLYKKIIYDYGFPDYTDYSKIIKKYFKAFYDSYINKKLLTKKILRKLGQYETLLASHDQKFCKELANKNSELISLEADLAKVNEALERVKNIEATIEKSQNELKKCENR